MNFDQGVLQVAIEDIIPNRFQPRLSFDDAALSDLADSIKQHGIIQPLVLRRTGNKYEIIAGERRYKAAKMAGLASVPAVISQLDDKKSAEVAVVENVQRKDLSAIEEAKSYKALLDLGYMSQDQLAKRMGVSQSAISNKLRLLNLTEEVQDAIIDGKISERHARALLSIKDEDKQNEWLNKIIKERLTVRQLDELIKNEFGVDSKMNDNNIEFIKNNAIDINIANDIKEETNDTGFSVGPINLGEKAQNRFFNNLESEEANMEMTEAISPFANPTYLNSIPTEEPSEYKAESPEDNEKIALKFQEENDFNEQKESFMDSSLQDQNSELNNSEDVIESTLPEINSDFNNTNETEEPSLSSPISNFDNAEEIESLDDDLLAFSTTSFDLDSIINKVNDFINQLNEKYQVMATNNKLDDEVTFVITVREKK